MAFVDHCPIEGGSQVYVAAGGATDDVSNRTTHPQGGDAHTSSDALLQGLGSDLRGAQHHQGVNPFQRNPLVAFGRRYDQRPTTMLHPRLVITDVHGTQVSHWNTTLLRYRVTRSGVLVGPGRQ